MLPLYTVSVQTLISHSDGRLFADLGTMVWPHVDDEVVAWLSGSCRTTATWLLGLPEAIGDSYTLKYRTLVKTDSGEVVSDTTMLEFGGLAYDDVVRFEQWALRELGDLLQLFVAQHGNKYIPTRRRNKTLAIARVLWAVIRNKIIMWNGVNRG